MKLYESLDGIKKALAIRSHVLVLKHEVKDALKSGIKTIDIQRLNERLQHIAKLPRPQYDKIRCVEGRCRCRRGIIDGFSRWSELG